MRASKAHPHPGRMAEVYRPRGGKLVWVGYTAGPDYADHPKGLEWSDELKAWVHTASTPCTPRTNTRVNT